MLCERPLACQSVVELPGVEASGWGTLVQAVEGLCHWRPVVPLIQKGRDQLSDLIQGAFSNLCAKLDYNNDLVVLAEETRYRRDLLLRVYVCI